MPTYDYRCNTCKREEAVFQTIRSYCASPIRPKCCGFLDMERKLSVVPGTASSNPLAGDRHYEGLNVPGTEINIGSRTAHRNYMKQNELALASDFKETWKKSAEQRTQFRQGTSDSTLKRDVREVVERAIQN